MDVFSQSGFLSSVTHAAWNLNTHKYEWNLNQNTILFVHKYNYKMESIFLDLNMFKKLSSNGQSKYL